MRRLVVDVSAAQGARLDIHGFLAADVVGAYVESTVGNDGPNPHYQTQVQQFRDAGIAVGAYLFAYPLPNATGHVNRDPRGQALLFYNDSGGLGDQAGELPPMLDSEWPPPKEWAQWSVTQATIASWLDACAEDIDGLWNRTCGIYTDGGGFWKPLGGAVLQPSFAARKLWFAEYPLDTPRSDVPTDAPAPLPPWTEPPLLWQFTDKFAIGESLYNMSVFLGTDADWDAILAA